MTDTKIIDLSTRPNHLPDNVELWQMVKIHGDITVKLTPEQAAYFRQTANDASGDATSFPCLDGPDPDKYLGQLHIDEQVRES